MRSITGIIAVVALTLAAQNALAQESDCTSLDTVSWLEGTWVTESNGRRTTETWAFVSDDTVEGEGRVTRISTGEQTGSETLRLVVMGGEVFYLAKIASNPFPVPFALVACDATSATFENMEHDFPRRLEYTWDGDQALNVQVSDGAGNGFTLPFVRER